jgi:hypothetical protein
MQYCVYLCNKREYTERSSVAIKQLTKWRNHNGNIKKET